MPLDEGAKSRPFVREASALGTVWYIYPTYSLYQPCLFRQIGGLVFGQVVGLAFIVDVYQVDFPIISNQEGDGPGPAKVFDMGPVKSMANNKGISIMGLLEKAFFAFHRMVR